MAPLKNKSTPLEIDGETEDESIKSSFCDEHGVSIGIITCCLVTSVVAVVLTVSLVFTIGNRDDSKHTSSAEEMKNDDGDEGVTFEDALQAILENLIFLSLAKKDLNDTATNCFVGPEESCALSSFNLNAPYVVYPNSSDARCIFSNSTPYSFQVVRGDPKKLLVYFQGGGACWNEVSTTSDHGPLCISDAIRSPLKGMLSRNEKYNPFFYDYTLVEILYCSGDVHSGNVTRLYVDGAGMNVTQSGAANTLAVMNWLQQQDMAPDELIIAGCSAGSIGAQVWAHWIMTNINATHTAVIPDSFVGYFPPGSQGPLITSFGVCGGVLLEEEPSLNALCLASNLTVQDVVTNALEQHPSTQIAFTNSKTDAVQIGFYKAIGELSNENYDGTISPTSYYVGINEIFQLYSRQANFVAFLISSSFHCITDNAYFYLADTSGPVGDINDAETVNMRTWTGKLPLGKGSPDSSIAWACYGKKMSLEEAEESSTAPREYCDSALTNQIPFA